MLFKRLAHPPYKFSKIALAVRTNIWYGIYKFPMFNGGEPIALAVKALLVKALVPTVVGVSPSASPTAISYRSSQLLGCSFLYPNSKWYDSS